MKSSIIPFASLRFNKSYNLPNPEKSFIVLVYSIDPSCEHEECQTEIEICCEEEDQVKSIVKNIKGSDYSLVEYLDLNWIIKKVEITKQLT